MYMLSSSKFRTANSKSSPAFNKISSKRVVNLKEVNEKGTVAALISFFSNDSGNRGSNKIFICDSYFFNKEGSENPVRSSGYFWSSFVKSVAAL